MRPPSSHTHNHTYVTITYRDAARWAAQVRNRLEPYETATGTPVGLPTEPLEANFRYALLIRNSFYRSRRKFGHFVYTKPQIKSSKGHAAKAT